MSSYLLQIVLILIYVSKVLSSYVYQYPTQYQQTYTPTPVPQIYPPHSQTYTKPAPEYKSYQNYPYQPPPIAYPKPQIEQTKPCPKPQPISEHFVKTPDQFVKMPEPYVKMPEPYVKMPEPYVKMPDPATKPDDKRSGFDTNVLNNLAIALQLLIVSNIINNPPTESCQDFEKAPEANIWQKLPEHNEDLSNYPSYPKPPRPGRLMSPYEAINKNSFSDIAKYSAKKDFQNPYSAILAYENNKDLFSMADLF